MRRGWCRVECVSCYGFQTYTNFVGHVYHLLLLLKTLASMLSVCERIVNEMLSSRLLEFVCWMVESDCPNDR